jgi:hypothetical protein
MSQHQEMTEEQATELITRLLGTSAETVLHRFEFGWLARRKLSPQDISRGRHIGLGSYIIDRTGVVTVHSSLPIPMVIEEYREARTQGRTTGRQIWPEPTRTPPTDHR